jgi:hypothetical protein
MAERLRLRERRSQPESELNEAYHARRLAKV